MFLILSAAYVDQELQSEFGKIPPCFLPLGNKRLFEHQKKLVPEGVAINLSIPESYQVSKTDLNLLRKLSITLVRTPDGISLGASLVAALSLSEHDFNSPLSVLYGDTLFNELPTGDDLVCVSSVTESYNWAVVTGDDHNWLKDSDNKIDSDAKNIVNGYFKFSEPRQLMRAVTQSSWDFLAGLNRYHQTVGLTTVYSEGWLDFGHVNTYYRSKTKFTTQRSFNELIINSHWVEKSSTKNSKIAAESNWFANLPYSLRGYTPQYLGYSEREDKVSYRLEYLHQTALNELYVFGELSVSTWEKILDGCVDFLKACSKEPAAKGEPYNSLVDLFGKKTITRLKEYCEIHAISLSDEWSYNQQGAVSLTVILQETEKHLPNLDNKLSPSVLHGDFCFSNILYDFRAGRIKTIDPRGILPNGDFSLYGDIRYDVAKLSHSIIGMYDWIIAGYYEVEISGNHIDFQIRENQQQKLIQQRFVELIEKEFGISAVSLLAMQIQLFLSMLPLHEDDTKRQQAFFANAFRLYNLMMRFDR